MSYNITPTIVDRESDRELGSDLDVSDMCIYVYIYIYIYMYIYIYNIIYIYIYIDR